MYKGVVSGQLFHALTQHVAPVRIFATVQQTLKLPTGDFIPDVVAWAQRLTDQQQETIALTPMPNLWVEVIN